MSGETRTSDIRTGLSGARSSPPSIVEISPPDIARRRLAHWGAIQADNVRITRRETFEYGFQARRHLLIAYERAERDDGETLIEGLPKSTLREFNCKLSLVPAGHRFYGWQTPRVLTRVTYFYIDLQDWLFDPELRHRSRDQPAPVLLRSSRLGHRTQTQGRGRQFRPIEPPICRGLEPRPDARTYPIGPHDIRAARPLTWRLAGMAAETRGRIHRGASLGGNFAGHSRGARRSEPLSFCARLQAILRRAPHRYHMARRMDRARSLLQRPALSVTQIGVQIGFRETSSFTRAFRRFTGLTPTEYRRHRQD